MSFGQNVALVMVNKFVKFDENILHFVCWKFLYRHIRELAPPPGGHVLLDIIINFRNLQEGHLKTFPAKFQYNLASGFREKDF